MSETKEKTPSAYFATLKETSDSQALQELILGTVITDAEALEEAHEALVTEAEEAGDDEDYAKAADAFIKVSVLAWEQGDNRLIENFTTQALYYGTLNGFDSLVENFSTVWSMWAHMLPKLKPRDRARLQDFARFRRSFELGLRKVQGDDKRIGTALTLLVPTFDTMGALNLKGIDDRKADLTEETSALWDEVGGLISQIESSAA